MAKKIYTPSEYREKLEMKAKKRDSFYNCFTKTAAVLLGCAIVFSSTVIAYKRVNTKAPVYIQGTENMIDENTTMVTQSGESTTVTDGSNQTSSNAQTESNSAQQSTENKPLATPLAQYEYFVKSFNNVKTNAKSVNNYRKKAVNYKDIAEAGAFSGVLSSLMDRFLKEEVLEDAQYQGAEIKKFFPPAGETCHLEKKDVASVSCKEEGNYYIITIKAKNERNPKAGYGVGSIASIISREQIMDPIKNIPGLRNLDPTCDYENVSCVAKIEKSTGNMVDFMFDMPLILTFEKQNFKIGLQFFEWWQINY